MLRFIEWFFSLFLRKKVNELKSKNDAEKYILVKEYEKAKEDYRKKFLKPKRYRKAPRLPQRR